VLFKKRWSDGLHNDFEHVDEFESKFGLFGGDGGDSGGGGGDVGSQVDSFSDMPGSVDVASQVDSFSDVPAFSAAPAAPAPSVDTFAEIGGISPVASKGFGPVDTFAEIGNLAPVASTPMGLGSLSPQQSYNPFSLAEEVAAKNRAAQQPGLMAAVSGRPDLSFLSANAIDRALAPSSVAVTPQAAREQATASLNMPSVDIAGVPVSAGAVPAVGGVGLTTPALGGTLGLGVGLGGPTIGFERAFKDGGVVSLLRR